MDKIIVDVETGAVSAANGHLISGAAHENTGATSDQAPVLYTIRSEGSLDATDIAAKMIEETGRGTLTEAEMAITAIGNVIAKLLTENGGVTISCTNWGTMQTYCAGSTQDPHANPEPESVYLGFSFEPAQVKEFAKLEVTVGSGEIPSYIKRVRDKTIAYDERDASGDGDGFIVGRMPFWIFGRGLVKRGAAENAELWNADVSAKVCDVTLDEALDAGRWEAHLPEELDPGMYTLVINTTGGTDKLWRISKAVEVKAAEPVDWPSEPTTGVNLLVDARGESVYGIKQIAKSEAGASFTVDWGDGTTPADYTATQSNLSHTYAAPGVYRVTISGAAQSVMIGDQEITPDPLWGVKYPSMVAKVQYVAASSGAILGDFFARGAKNLKSVDVSGGDFQNLSSGAYMGCAKLESLALPASIVTIKEGPLVGCAKLATLSGFPNVDDVEGDGTLQPFADCAALAAVHFAAAKREDVQDTACYRANQKFGLPNGEIVYDL